LDEKMKKIIDIEVKGMSCASCVNRVEKAILKEHGIYSASVNIATERARVELNDELTEASRIIDLISKAGYGAELIEETQNLTITSKTPSIWPLIISMTLSLPLILPMILMIFGTHFMLPPLFQLILSTPIQFFVGARFYKSAWVAIKNKSGNMDLLVSIGTSAAFGLSLFNLLKHKPDLYFESSSMVITLVLLGKFLEAKAKGQTLEAIKSLQKLRPQIARVERNSAVQFLLNQVNIYQSMEL